MRCTSILCLTLAVLHAAASAQAAESLGENIQAFDLADLTQITLARAEYDSIGGMARLTTLSKAASGHAGKPTSLRRSAISPNGWRNSPA